MKRGIALVAVFLAVMFFSLEYYSNKVPIVKIVSAQGSAATKVTESSSYTPLVIDQLLYAGAIIQTGIKSMTSLELMTDASKIELGENTCLEVRPFTDRELKQIRGIAIYRVSKQGKDFRIQTPHGMASILGTVFRVDINDVETSVYVKEGKVAFTNNSGHKVFIEGGQKFLSSDSNAVVERIGNDEIDKIFNNPTDYSYRLPGKEINPSSVTPSQTDHGNRSIASDSAADATIRLPDCRETIILSRNEQHTIPLAGFGSIVLAGPSTLGLSDRHASLPDGYAFFDICSSDASVSYEVKTSYACIKATDAIFGVNQTASSTIVTVLSGSLLVSCDEVAHELQTSFSAEISTSGLNQKKTSQNEHAFWSSFPEELMQNSVPESEEPEQSHPEVLDESSRQSPRDLLEQMTIEKPKGD